MLQQWWFIVFTTLSCHFQEYSFENMFIQCSKTCGAGFQFRRIECRVRSQNHSSSAEPNVQSRMCNGLGRPSVSKECAMNPCDAKYRWSVGPWSQVSIIFSFIYVY